MRLPILCLALCQYTICDSSICNQKTHFECPCEECPDYTQSHDSIDWLHIHLTDCPPTSLSESTFRRKIAGWINEECGASLNCHLNRGLEENNIVIGDFSCQRKEISILALRNFSAPIMLGERRLNGGGKVYELENETMGCDFALSIIGGEIVIIVWECYESLGSRALISIGNGGKCGRLGEGPTD